ncbi:hypothetical protein SDC9_115510 [bioreactor metagenome]|uniref:Uncharacterized protein n=1 Tax=bioreactor metagenome TaxID=1076179 RepID=A0A645BT72_9ZZZZ
MEHHRPDAEDGEQLDLLFEAVQIPAALRRIDRNRVAGHEVKMRLRNPEPFAVDQTPERAAGLRNASAFQ